MALQIQSTQQFQTEVLAFDGVSVIDFWAEWYRVPKKEIALMPDWDTKLKKMIESVSVTNISSLSGVPSWMLMLLEGVMAYTNKSIEEVWPNIEVYFHG